MRPSVLSAAITGWFTAAFGFHVTTFAANPEGIVTPEQSEEHKQNSAAEQKEEVETTDDIVPDSAAVGDENSPEGGAEVGEDDNLDAVEPEEEMLDAESLLSAEELQALEAELGDPSSAKPEDAAPAPSPMRTAPDASDDPENEVSTANATVPAAPDGTLANDEGLTEVQAQRSDALVTEAELAAELGVATPLSRREPTLAPFQIEGGFRYGLVGTGPTRFVDDLRFSWAEGVELRTSFAPYPSSLMLRLQAGKSDAALGAWVIDAGIANWDAGWRLVVDTGEAAVGARVHWEVVLAWQKVLTEKLSWFNASHLRYRMSGLSDDDQSAIAFESVLTYDLMPTFSVSAGLGYARTLGTPVREVAVSFVETGRPGITHFLVRDDALDEDLSESNARQSATIPLALTYGTTESFDVDLFCTPRIFPKFDIVFGAGLRVRYDLL